MSRLTCCSISSIRSFTSCFDRACASVERTYQISARGRPMKTSGRAGSGSMVLPPSVPDNSAATVGIRCSIALSRKLNRE